MSVTNLVSRARQEVARAFLFHVEGARKIVVAVSGGADSLCLADAAIALADELNLQPILAHLNHGLRGAEADADEQFVTQFAMRRNVVVENEKIDVARLAREKNQSVEVAGREARYAFLARVAHRHGANIVVVAHHADDQAETVLLRLIRGTGIAGLRGMSAISRLPDAPDLILLRPLLRITRKEIERYCADLGLQPRHDSTNDALDHTRNRIRHELLPTLESYNPGIRQVLARLADSAASDIELIEFAAQRAFAEFARETSDGILMNRNVWRGLSAGIQRALLRESVQRLKGDLKDLKYDAIEEARDVLNSDAASGEIALMANVRVTFRATELLINKLEIL
jgi:tRNA(Ile)-lysidine synthase